MTRKDYQLIADALKANRGWTEHVHVVDGVAYSLAQSLKRDNPRFDVTRFLVACGIPESEINQ